jgi:hypothetical protein
VVASYLDNELPVEQVTEYEKRCLTSDVHLAEVASVHQILSLIGQKAKVPPEARLRMYRLVKGREASGKATPPPPRPETDGARPKITEPVTAWDKVTPPPRPMLERFGPRLAVLGLIGVLVGTAIYSLRPDGKLQQVALNVPEQPGRPAEPIPANPNVPAAGPATPPPDTQPGAEATTEPKPAEPKPAESAQGTETATFEALQGVVLRPTADGNGWDRVAAKDPLKERTRLLNLAPFRNTLKLGRSEVELIDSTDVVIDDLEKDQPARIELLRGQFVLHPSTVSTPFAVRFEGQVLAITPAVGVSVGFERMPTLVPGQSEPAPARLRIFLPEGQATLKVGELQDTLNGPGEISLQTSGQLTEKGRQPVPPWVTETTPSSFVKEIGDQFAGLLRPGRPLLTDLVEAMDDPQKDVKRMAVQALGAIGAMELVVTVLNRKEDPAIHRTVVDVLRTGLAQGGESAKVVRQALVREYDQPWADITERLIVGYRPEDAKDESKIAKLVEYLTAPSRGTRELALDNLRALTGRDSLEYDPETPEGKGLKAWQDLVRKKETGKEARPANAGPR